MQPEELPSILTLKQASELLNCHPNTLRKWEQQGVIKCYRFGSRGDRRFRKEDILALLKSNDLNQQH
jgi:excisionase family DNA binding protein